MKYLTTLSALLVSSLMFGQEACLSASGQITYPYNPDGDGNGLIGVMDLQDLLSTYGGAFAPGAIVVDSVELGQVLGSLQSQIVALQNGSGDGFRCGDDVLHEGYWYNTTSIGGQCWFAENLRYLPEVSPSTEVSDLNPKAYVYGYDGVEVFNAKNTLEYHQFGALYNFPAVQQWDLCPSGWHVPTDLEWTEMTNSLGSFYFRGNLMKVNFSKLSILNASDDIDILGCTDVEACNYNPNAIDDDGSCDFGLCSDGWKGTNLSGFSGLPGGYTGSDGFFYAEDIGKWWSSSPDGSNAYGRGLDRSAELVFSGSYLQRYGFSVRCVRDAE